MDRLPCYQKGWKVVDEVTAWKKKKKVFALWNNNNKCATEMKEIRRLAFILEKNFNWWLPKKKKKNNSARISFCAFTWYLVTPFGLTRDGRLSSTKLANTDVFCVKTLVVLESTTRCWIHINMCEMIKNFRRFVALCHCAHFLPPSRKAVWS